MSRRRRSTNPPPSYISSTNDDDWYSIKAILDERKTKFGKLEYLVDWEGLNPETGEPYEPWWIRASEVTADAIREWRLLKTAREHPQPRLPEPSPSPSPRNSRPPDLPPSSDSAARATSLQAYERPAKRPRLRLIVSASSSPLTSSQGSQSRPTREWHGQSPAYRSVDLRVELPRAPTVNPDDYLSIAPSQSSPPRPSQPQSSPQPPSPPPPPSQLQSSLVLPPSSPPIPRPSPSGRVIPDSQADSSQSHDTPNDPRAASDSLRAILGLPQSPSLYYGSSSNGFQGPRLTPFSQESINGSRGFSVASAPSLPEVLRRPDTETEDRNSLAVAPISQLSIPSRQPDSFRTHSQSPLSIPSSYTGRYKSSQRIGPLHRLLLPKPSNSQPSPQFLTQPPFTLPPLSTSPAAQPSHPSPEIIRNSFPSQQSADGLRIPETLSNSRRRESSQTRTADFGSAQPRDSYVYQTQVGPDPLDSSQRLTSSSVSGPSERAVPETVLRRPPPYPAFVNRRPPIIKIINRGLARRNHDPISSSPERIRIRIRSQHSAPSQPPLTMDGTPAPPSSAVDELLEMQQQFLSQVAAAPLMPSSLQQSSHADQVPEAQPSPMRATQDPMLSSVAHAEGGAHPLAAPFRPESRPETEGVPGPGSAPLFHPPPVVALGGSIVPAQLAPMDHPTIAPNDLQPLTLNPASVFPSDLTTGTDLPHTSGRRLPGHHDIFAPPQRVPIDAASDVTNDSADEASEAGGPSRAGYSTEVKEYMVTLPFSSSRRPLYDDIILQSRPDIEDFCQVFHNEVLRTPRPSSVHKIEKLFLSLLNICDLPPELDARSFKKLSPKEIQKYAFESNSKYAFIWEVLHSIRNHPKKVLIVARSEKILFLLENLVVAEHYAYSRTGLGDMKYDHAQWPINIILSLPNQPLAERTSDFDLIIGFDYEFKRSNVASRLSDYTPSESRQPMVLQLVLTHSIEHLDLSITEKDPDMPSLDHKNAIVIGLTKLRRLILNPDVGREPPHETAARFANQLKYYSEDFTWEPIPIPDEIFNFYLESSQPVEIESLQSKKRKLDDTESLATKRRRISNKSASMVNAERVEALAPIIRCLGPEALDREDLKHETLVPTSLLAAMEVKFNERSTALQELRALVKELRQMNEDLQMQNNSYAKSTAAVEKDHLSAVEDRGRFCRERDAALLEVKKLSERLSATQEAKSKLAKELAELKATHASNEPRDGPAPAASAGAAPAPATNPATAEPPEAPVAGTLPEPDSSKPEDERLKQAEVEIQKLTKKVESAERELDYTREAYQNASQSASDLGNENRDLTGRIADLEHKASENLRQIHQINLENQAARLARLNDEQAATLREREWELDRLRDEVRILKAARRETRQASVPRSPHMGVMSPRAAGRAMTAGAATPGVGGPPSRGSSPAAATDASGVPLFGQQPGNGRWGHLRD